MWHFVDNEFENEAVDSERVFQNVLSNAYTTRQQGVCFEICLRVDLDAQL